MNTNPFDAATEFTAEELDILLTAVLALTAKVAKDIETYDTNENTGAAQQHRNFRNDKIRPLKGKLMAHLTEAKNVAIRAELAARGPRPGSGI
jgi:hypothetical protein